MAGAPSQAASANAPESNANTPALEGWHIAYTHRYTIEAERTKQRAVLEAHAARCAQLDCVMVSQTFADENKQMPLSGALTVRVSRKDRDKCTEALKGGGDSRVLSQATSAQDKTVQVVDIEARVANLM